MPTVALLHYSQQPKVESRGTDKEKVLSISCGMLYCPEKSVLNVICDKKDKTLEHHST